MHFKSTVTSQNWSIFAKGCQIIRIPDQSSPEDKKINILTYSDCKFTSKCVCSKIENDLLQTHIKACQKRQNINFTLTLSHCGTATLDQQKISGVSVKVLFMFSYILCDINTV